MRLGRSRVGAMLGSLLACQGAREVRSGEGGAGGTPAMSLDPAIDIVIDDQTAAAGTRIEAADWRRADPRVIYVRFTDFPRTHPRWSDRSTLVDEMIHAELGLNRIGGGVPDPEPLSMASAYGAIWGAIHVVASLKARDESGSGNHVEFPLFAAGITVMARKLLELDDKRLVDPLTIPHLPLAEIYACADGRHVQMQGHSGRFVEAMLKVGGCMEWCEAASTGLHLLPDRASEEMWRARLSAMFREHPALQWEEQINAAGGACTVCRSRAEWLNVEHADAAGIIVKGVKGPAGAAGREPVPVVPAVRAFAAGPAGSAGAGAQDAGLRSAAPAMPAAKAGANTGLPLAGLRVVDFAIILAGPTCGRTLAELGAEVIKIDAPVRPTSMYGWLDVNRGKRSIALDLTRPTGRDIALRLMAKADVVVENFRAGKMDKLGLGFADAVRRKGDIVYASLNAFDFGGSWAERAGWEHNAQAATGMQMARARDGTPQMVPVPVNDYSTGLLGAYGVLLGLRRARAMGTAVWVGGSLARTASFIQSEELAAAMSGGREHAPAPTQAVRCADGWVRILIETPEDSGKLRQIEASLAGGTCAGLLARLRAEGIPAVQELTVAELQADGSLDAAGLRVSWQHPHWGAMQQIAARPEVSGFASRAGWPAPDPGDNTDEILAGLGYSRPEIADLKRSGAVSERVALFS